MKKNVPYLDVAEITSLQDMVLQSASKFQNHIALKDLNPTPLQQVTYEELLDTILRFGTALQNLGLKERTHIALIGENRVQWAITYLTCMCFNYVVVPIDKNLTPNEILNIIHESASEAIIFSESYADVIEEHHTGMKNLKHAICMDRPYNSKTISMMDLINKTEPIHKDDLPLIEPNELAEIIFTSGSLGRAKGVMLSQKNLTTNLMDMVSMISITDSDRFLSVLPIHHTYECTCGMLCPIYGGATVGFARSLKTIVDDMQTVKPTIFLGVPLLYDKMFKRITKSISEDRVKSILVPGLVRITDFTEAIGLNGVKKKIFKELHEKFGGKIRIFIVGGAAADPQVVKGLRSFGFTFLQGYGLTETSPILTVNREEIFKDEAAGLPLPTVKLKIHEPDQDGVGEVWAKGPSVMLGYYNSKEQTEAAFSEDGWFKTGDLGIIDDDGFLHIRGRKKNVIISKSGKNVFPEEIEDYLNKSQYILECMVYGEKDAKQDEVIAAQIVVDAESFIELAETKKVKIEDDLIFETISKEIETANKQLASYKRIKRFHIRDKEFEKTTTQKIKRYLVTKHASKDEGD